MTRKEDASDPDADAAPVDAPLSEDRDAPEAAEATLAQETAEATSELESRLTELETALELERTRSGEVLARLQRTAADFDNFRKRARRESDESRRYAKEDVIGGILDIVSNFERALEAENASVDAVLEGVTLIHRQVLRLIEKEGVEPIPALGERFDPRLHEALLRTETVDVEDGVIIEELEKGWMLHERVLRPAKVRVAVRPALAPAPSEAPTADPGESA